jgi:23S rRNA-/tRNA-specific pseudouridylate synthase
MWEFRAQKTDRLDRILREQNSSPWMSRQAWEKAFAEGRVRVNGKLAKKPGEQVGEASQITVDLPELGLKAERPAPRLVWESPDASLAVFYKEAGIPTHPLFPWETGTLANRIQAFAEDKGRLFAELAAAPSLEGGLLQRLDRDTSGLVTTAFTAEAKALYRKVFSGEVNKGYWAIVSGSVEGKHEVYFPQSSAPKVLARVAGKEGDTKVEFRIRSLASTAGHSLVEVHTSQGLRHVVRAGLGILGAPLVGDELYGGSGEMPFHQLHARSLQIPGFSEISASAPQSFLDCLEKLGLDYSG